MSDVSCTRRVDDYRQHCGSPAEYLIFGDPCSCTEVYDHDECYGHAVCGECVADLRMNAVRVHRRREPTFQPARITTLAVST